MEPRDVMSKQPPRPLTSKDVADERGVEMIARFVVLTIASIALGWLGLIVWRWL